jgi:acyl transferase domain-containing protein
MACRLPGGLHSPQELWEFLLAKGDARTRVPETRYNISAYHSPTKKPGMTVSEYGYFLDESVDLAALDTSFFSMPRREVERLDPQQRLLLEVSREALEDAGEVNWKGENIGVYIGTYGQDWYDLVLSETQRYSTYQVTTSHDFMVSNRVSYEMDLRGPR